GGAAKLSLAAVTPEAKADEPNDRADILFDDFEGGMDKWTAEGEAFVGNPKPNHHDQRLQGYRGKGLADSFRNGGKAGYTTSEASDAHTGKLVSKPFTIERRAIKLLVGGGRHKGKTCVNLVVGGKVVQSVTGSNSETLEPRVFETSKLEGKEAHLEIVDSHTEGWGHVLVDHIVFSDDLDVEPRPLDQLPDYGTMALLAAGDGRPFRSAGIKGSLPEAAFDLGGPSSVERDSSRGKLIGSVGRSLSLEPGKSATVTFVLAWHFNNSQVDTRSGGSEGRYYATRFPSAGAV
ncbi:MAG: hypothetical protein GY720_00845, partial [bacterium]|nr:hypothetical protein [bacterium]